MVRVLIAAAVLAIAAPHSQAAFTLSFDHSDFGITSTFNNVRQFSFEIVIDDDLVAGMAYSNPSLVSVDYRIVGVLTSPTPSMFPGFNLMRTVIGADFYNLSPDAELSFAIDLSADLTDGLQFSELSGSGTVFSFNAREFNQNPGRYHPPIFSLNSDGTGRLVNANNQSTFNNPPPPLGSGLPVDVLVAEEYDVSLSFNTSLLIAVPEPSPWPLLILIMASWRRFHQLRKL